MFAMTGRMSAAPRNEVVLEKKQRRSCDLHESKDHGADVRAKQQNQRSSYPVSELKSALEYLPAS